MIKFNLLTDFADHLKNGELSDTSYNFKDYKRCYLRESVLLWPNEWKLNSDGEPIIIRSYNDKPYSCAREFFGLKPAAYDHLFVPFMQKPALFGGRLLDDDATKEQVANNILDFCNKRKDLILQASLR